MGRELIRARRVHGTDKFPALLVGGPRWRTKQVIGGQFIFTKAQTANLSAFCGGNFPLTRLQ